MDRFEAFDVLLGVIRMYEGMIKMSDDPKLQKSFTHDLEGLQVCYQMIANYIVETSKIEELRAWKEQ